MGGNKLEALNQLKTLKCIRCLKDATLILLIECRKCNLHKDHKCTFSLSDKRIEILPLNSPHRFNRQLFRSISENIRSETLNYYTPTKILLVNFRSYNFISYAKVKSFFCRHPIFSLYIFE